MSENDLLYGLHSVEALLRRSTDRVKSILIAQNTHNSKINQLITLAEAAGIPIKKVDREALDKMTSGSTHQGVVAQCRSRVQYSESDIISLLAKVNAPPFLLILDQIEDPHNLGACLRVADAAGIHMVITPKHHSTSITPTVSKVACGAAETVPFIQVTNLSQCVRKLQKEGIWVFGMAGEAEMSLYQADLKGPLALVTGAEGAGLRRLTRDCCDSLLHIPMHGTVSSLNVSVATGICLFEAVRQRH